MKSMRLSNSRGFSLVELMVSVAIVGLLASFASNGYKDFQERARAAGAKMQINAIIKGLLLLKAETGFDAFAALGGQETYIDDCKLNLICTDGTVPDWAGPYYTGPIRDPWNSKYVYEPDYSTPDGVLTTILSAGPDKVETYSSDGDSDDIFLLLPVDR